MTRFFLALVFATPPALAAALETHRYDADGQTYTYSVKPTGENYTFEFDQNPGSESRQLRAASAVFKTIYADESIAPPLWDNPALVAATGTQHPDDAALVIIRDLWLKPLH